MGGGGGMGGGGMGGGGMGGGGMSMRSAGGGGGIPGGGPSVGPSFIPHNMSGMGHMPMADHDFRHDQHFDHDHDHFRRFRFFPTFAFGVDTYADNYAYPYECWNVIRVRTHLGWRWRRIWVCD
jgi:hypothetical protein